MKKLLRKVMEIVRDEPVRVASVIASVVPLLASAGFAVTGDTTESLISAVFFISLLLGGEGVRTQTTPKKKAMRRR